MSSDRAGASPQNVEREGIAASIDIGVKERAEACARELTPASVTA